MTRSNDPVIPHTIPSSVPVTNHRTSGPRGTGIGPTSFSTLRFTFVRPESQPLTNVNGRNGFTEPRGCKGRLGNSCLYPSQSEFWTTYLFTDLCDGTRVH